MPKNASIVKLSPKYQIVVPKAFRSSNGIRPGVEFEVVPTQGGLRLVRIQPLAKLRGSVRKDRSVAIRDKEDRF